MKPQRSSLMNAFIAPIWSALAGDPRALSGWNESGEGALPSVFAVTDLASAAVGAAGLAATGLLPEARREAVVDRRLASLWFVASCGPVGWSPPPPWDPIAGDYQ